VDGSNTSDGSPSSSPFPSPSVSCNINGQTCYGCPSITRWPLIVWAGSLPPVVHRPSAVKFIYHQCPLCLCCCPFSSATCFSFAFFLSLSKYTELWYHSIALVVQGGPSSGHKLTLGFSLFGSLQHLPADSRNVTIQSCKNRSG
jgi:hypothetical protein